MKFVTFIVAFIILGLSVWPCGDAKSMTMNVKEPITQDLHSSPDDHKDSHQDNCSPLCICSCCSVASVFNPLISVEVSPVENHISHESRYTGALISISLPIWQPPQLV